jgi:hypothetical protein
MRDVSHGARLDFAVLAVGFAEEEGRGRIAVGHGGNVHAYIIHNKHIRYKLIQNLDMPTKSTEKTAKPIKIKEFPGLEVRTSV